MPMKIHLDIFSVDCFVMVVYINVFLKMLLNFISVVCCLDRFPEVVGMVSCNLA